ncbi:MAG: hypothetical protein U9N53_01820 [Bacteroidota bacterium]|nr:hypothetical protein [Bacteroidota bacterium]
MDEQEKTTAGQGFGIASLILGIVALLIALIPCIGLFALIPGIVAIVLAIVGLSQASKANGAKGVIIAGLVVSILGTTIAAVWLIFFSAGGAFLNEIKNNPEVEGIFEEIIEDISDEIKDSKTFEVTIESDDSEDLEKTLEDLEKGETTEEGDTEPEDSSGVGL